VSDELLTAGAAARRIGVAVTTLRSWHQRYGLGPSAHEFGHHRRYDRDDMARLTLMQELVSTGVSPAEAARWARRAPEPPGVASPAGAARDGGGHALAVGDADPAARGLGRTAMRLDILGVRQLIGEAVAERGVVEAWDEVIRPVLAAIGERAGATGDLVEVEHLLSGCVSATFAALPRPARGAPVRLLLACADEEQHSLPIEALAAALTVRGVPARVLGARVPPRALRAAVRRTGPAAVMIWAQVPGTARPGQLTDLLSGHGRPPLVAAGGPGWDRTTLPFGVVAPASLQEAVELFAAAAS
jgi:DNA-binding transcriptional MerR regulator